MKAINQTLKEIREKKGLSQMAVAQKLNKTQSAYARIELGSTKLDIYSLEKFAEIMEISIIDILTYPEIWGPVETNSEIESKVILQVELKKEKKDQVLKLAFGENVLEILNK
jgi:transcriptional regulator with XRE-family HTH domain